MIKITHINRETFTKYIQENPIAIIEYSADWCHPCRRLEEHLKRKNNINLEIAKIDVEKNRELAEEKGIQAIPTIQIYLNQQLIHEIIGFTKKEIDRTLKILAENDDPNKIYQLITR